ncbi:DNA-processing protein DprA [Streptomyces sp. NA02950]|uniref:DNA-processing protein DprA n=1 Tax=Streptomyces sp. NA02950 TaxID=2742137 RepID=UPI00158FF9EA|nr:DNA-processing protein DprA [Streptomyces sp. NA02950]QKV90381.1 DNA-processing protein DprA [Streptomyces sp. NA02950]QKV97286.1 DNA-processing protein DprA [Streptomyces sp. NA02950]
MHALPAPVGERAARAALAAFHSPESIAAELAEHGPEALWHIRVRHDHTGALSSYRPGPQLDAAQRTAQFVIPGDACWPAALDTLGTSTPLGLWVRGTGDLATLSSRAITVTGNRYATSRGKQRAALMAGTLALAGHTVTASLAHGIDAAAHSGAHLLSAPTLAVVPCGLDLCHPHDQRDLLRATAERGGAVVSVYRPGTTASEVTLRTTAALAAALSAAVVVVESIAHDPAMDSAAAARQLGRPLFAIPPDNDLLDMYATGTAQLLKSGDARPVLTAEQALAALA